MSTKPSSDPNYPPTAHFLLLISCPLILGLFAPFLSRPTLIYTLILLHFVVTFALPHTHHNFTGPLKVRGARGMKEGESKDPTLLWGNFHIDKKLSYFSKTWNKANVISPTHPPIPRDSSRTFKEFNDFVWIFLSIFNGPQVFYKAVSCCEWWRFKWKDKEINLIIGSKFWRERGADKVHKWAIWIWTSGASSRRGLAPPVLIFQTSLLCNIFTKITIFLRNRCQPSQKGLIFGRLLV